MITNTSQQTKDHQTDFNSQKKHKKLTEVTYANNSKSDYTEKIETLGSQFNYDDNRNHYWGPPELSLFYGSPLYNQSSDAQKLALNHLYWAIGYSLTASSEANGIFYNQVTEGLLSVIGDYDILCQELSLETAQEHHHIHAFHSIIYQTKKTLFVTKNSTFSKNKQKIPQRKAENYSRSKKLISQKLWSFPEIKLFKYNWSNLFESIYRSNKTKLYSSYLKKIETEGEPFPIQTTGFYGYLIPRDCSRFITLNFGSSPFLACFYYTLRYLANILQKNYEFYYFKYYRKLAKTEEFIPIPTSISYYHLLDESFHTTISQTIAQNVYKDFSPPTIYEKLVANIMLYRLQMVLFNGVSGVIPVVFRFDYRLIQRLYQILRSQIFEMSHQDALYWLEKSLTEEHDGFHVNLKYHQKVFKETRQALEPLNYLWLVNREMKVMASGSSLEKNLKNNRQVFTQFKKTIFEN